MTYIGRYLAILVCTLSLIPVVAQAYLPPESTPAQFTLQAEKHPLLAVTTAGERIVAAGLRGNIVYSNDAGKTWIQALVPVSVDLVAIDFPTSQLGWAVGHSGIVLKSTDGGANWTLELDGKSAAEQAVRYYQQASGIPSGVLEEEQYQLEQAQMGWAHPFMDVFFENDQSGYVVGPFNRLFHTADAGKSWEPWMHRVDNPEGLHFYAIERAGDAIYLVGEQGYVWKLGDGEQRFEQVRTPYDGTLFGLVPETDGLIVFGMRGNAFRSKDDGKSWQRLDLATRAGISGASLLDGNVVFTTLAGNIFRQNGGQGFKAMKVHRPMSSYFGIVRLSDASFAVVGPEGIEVKSESTSRQVKTAQIEN